MDSETFVTIGTPQPEDAKDVGAKDRNKVLPIHLQEPRDEQGRKRFHGAFTGGFSAGYFNTVGSKEGWTPSQFVSSRSSRPEARNASQRPEDFMDEEDMASLTANQQIAATEEFDILGGTARELARRKATVNAVERDGSAAPMALPAALVEDLIGPSKDPIGKKLLRQMGWREGHGVGPRARRRRRGDGKEDIYATEHLFAPKDVTVDTLKPKADHYGIGFDPYENAPEFAHLKKSAATKPSSEAKPAKRSGFGVGVFEDETEDLDVYGSSGMATYDMIIDDDEDERVFMRQKFGAARTSDGGSGDAPSRKTTGLNTEFLDIYSGLCNDGRPPLEGFVLAKKAPPKTKWYAPPDVPADFVPLHKFPPPSATQPAAPTSTTEWQGRQQSQTHSALSADARRDLLGEEALKAPQRSVFAYLPLKEQDRLQEYINKANRGREELAKRETAQNAPAPNEPKLDKQTAEAALKGFMPFGNDPPKQGRYRRFLEVAAGMATEYATVPKHLTAQDISHERLEFSKAAQIFKPLSSMMASRFTSATHTIEPGFAPSSKNLTTPQPNDTHLQKEAADLNMYGRLTRSVKEWRPEKLLCKRFGVPDPYMNAKKKEKVEDEKNEVAVAEGKRIHQREAVNEQVMSELLVERDRLVARGGLGMGMDPGRAALIGAASDGSSEKVSATPETEAKETSASAGEDEYERPPMDIFKAIFADSDDEVEEESDEEREGSRGNSALVEKAGDKPANGKPRAVILPPPQEDDPAAKLPPPTFRPMFRKKQDRGKKIVEAQVEAASATTTTTPEGVENKVAPNEDGGQTNGQSATAWAPAAPQPFVHPARQALSAALADAEPNSVPTKPPPAPVSSSSDLVHPTPASAPSHHAKTLELASEPRSPDSKDRKRSHKKRKDSDRDDRRASIGSSSKRKKRDRDEDSDDHTDHDRSKRKRRKSSEKDRGRDRDQSRETKRRKRHREDVSEVEEEEEMWVEKPVVVVSPPSKARSHGDKGGDREARGEVLQGAKDASRGARGRSRPSAADFM